ncbi:inositol monophosphatase family protein [Tautonia sociabilis]|uniref:Inositol-1-monophosphatase n=1 Tax=Tautonia sociabilis TaxID=2080755 RepID=A0A432MGK3_9BACT|nr:inositol monophosphatase family protein [Tautonia sociabilis]RUL85845.1 inositol monophosphatase [Tautonia sociabilis]
MPDDYSRYRKAAEEIAREAGEILREHYGRVSAREKGPSDLVTEADLASQRRIAERLASAFPDHTLLAEEEGVRPDPDRAFRWIVDPLDGTVNFAHGFPIWTVSIGLEHLGTLVAGAIYAPLTDTMWSAHLGGGTTVDGRPARVSAASRLADCLIGAAFPTRFGDDAPRQLALFERFSTGTHSVRRSGSTAWNLAMIASGGCDACFGTHVHPWDVAAGVLLVREAGGLVTALDGGAYDLYSHEILATNGAVHDEAARASRQTMGRG